MVLDNRHVLIGMLLALLVTEGSSQLGSGDAVTQIKDVLPGTGTIQFPTEPPQFLTADCDENFNFRNGIYELVTVKRTNTTQFSRVLFECSPRYELVGSSRLDCDHTVSPPAWTHPVPFCQQNECFNPPNITDGSRTWTGHNPGDMATYVCDTDFVLEGASPLSCRDGTFDWFPQAPVCKPVSCPQPAAPRNGVVATTGLTVGSIATWTCNNPYVLVGDEDAVCLSGGVWSRDPPTCEVPCYAPLPFNFYEQSRVVSSSVPVPHCGLSAADIIVVVDESESMMEGKDWLHQVMRNLDDSLKSRGIGLYPGLTNQYTLVGYGQFHFPDDTRPIAMPRVILDSSGNRLYGVDGFEQACAKLQSTGSWEDGYNSIRFALEDIPELRLRQARVAPIVILVTDEDRDRHRAATSLTRSGLKRLIRKSGAQLECIVDNSFLMNGREGYGMDAGGMVYRSGPDPSTYEKVPVTGNPRRVTGYRHANIRRDYTHVALELGGAAWDLKQLLQANTKDVASVQAFVDRTVDMVEHRVHKCCTCQCERIGIASYLRCQTAATAAECTQGRIPNVFHRNRVP
eukprot:scpid32777/ scgid16552/ Sushi, von Willebrand factor type A, EGF and pentraxin domain-containing protein 1; CCP module-containing protein 22; Polydom; Selectin-like osteoblast-derived protein; Serologically defined breast cancer antigen NY-BR-38